MTAVLGVSTRHRRCVVEFGWLDSGPPSTTTRAFCLAHALGTRVTRLCARALLLLFVAATNAAAVTIDVAPEGDLQAAINAAQPGDLILLAPGATYAGNFRLTDKPGEAFITIRTSGAFAG